MGRDGISTEVSQFLLITLFSKHSMQLAPVIGPRPSPLRSGILYLNIRANLAEMIEHNPIGGLATTSGRKKDSGLGRDRCTLDAVETGRLDEVLVQAWIPFGFRMLKRMVGETDGAKPVFKPDFLFVVHAIVRSYADVIFVEREFPIDLILRRVGWHRRVTTSPDAHRYSIQESEGGHGTSLFAFSESFRQALSALRVRPALPRSSPDLAARRPDRVSDQR